MPFGTSLDAEFIGTPTTNQRFTSYERSDIAKLDYAVNRSYSSGQGRFTFVDPIGVAASDVGNPQSLNLYSYTENNPIDFVDPSGLNEEIIGVVNIEDEEDPFEWFDRVMAASRPKIYRSSGALPELINIGNVGIVNITADPDPVTNEEPPDPFTTAVNLAKELMKSDTCKDLFEEGVDPGAKLDEVLKNGTLKKSKTYPKRNSEGGIDQVKFGDYGEVVTSASGIKTAYINQNRVGKFWYGAGTGKLINGKDGWGTAAIIIHELLHLIGANQNRKRKFFVNDHPDQYPGAGQFNNRLVYTECIKNHPKYPGDVDRKKYLKN